ncbi:MAG: peptidoglycan DD-metalloendopeptidase family protein [Epsilonproteobacteria bacterium]|nr:peptidoglycan DD-metalloendopeptidase family protein [Campylobacterota bacterium]
MIRLVYLLLFSTLLLARNDIDSKIQKTAKELDRYTKNYSKINKKMAQNAKAIILQKRKLERQKKFLKQLQKELDSKAQNYKESSLKLQELKKAQALLKKKQRKIEEELVFVIAKSVSLSMILQESYKPDADAMIEMEVLRSMLQKSKQKIQSLSKQYIANVKDVELLQSHAQTLENSIKEIDDKRKKLLQAQKEKKKALENLKRNKASYKKELQALFKRQNTLKKTLLQLNIIKIDAAKKAKEEKAQKEALSRKDIQLDSKNLPKVKKHGSSYQAMKTIRYRGPKTITPLSSYKITKKYGTYVDPIYGIKIFNESISLKPKKPNAKVRTVFNGKVIYADKTAVLDNIVIVEHKNGLHTIYANLSQIAPTIKKGKKIKKGYTIGRVQDELVFEVTQKSYHINPIRLFR